MECYLDGKLVQSADLPVRRTPSLFTSASREEKSGVIILKVVNPALEAVSAGIHLNGAGPLSATGAATILTAGLKDVNSFDEPRKVSPVTVPVNGVGPEFPYTFAANSMTVIRLRPAGRTE